MIPVASKAYILAAFLDRDERIVAKDGLEYIEEFHDMP
jgi:hypothetical protein